MRLKEGDIVDILYCDGESLLDVEIIYVPQAQGELWGFKREMETYWQNPQSSNFDTIIHYEEGGKP